MAKTIKCDLCGKMTSFSKVDDLGLLCFSCMIKRSIKRLEALREIREDELKNNPKNKKKIMKYINAINGEIKQAEKLLRDIK